MTIWTYNFVVDNIVFDNGVLQLFAETEGTLSFEINCKTLVLSSNCIADDEPINEMVFLNDYINVLVSSHK